MVEGWKGWASATGKGVFHYAPCSQLFYGALQEARKRGLCAGAPKTGVCSGAMEMKGMRIHMGYGYGPCYTLTPAGDISSAGRRLPEKNGALAGACHGRR